MDVIILRVVFIFHAGLTSSVTYEAFADWKSYSEAHAACQGHNSRHLAKIKLKNELNQAKQASNFDGLKKYWTALQVL